jgi:hypothetical protein
MTVLYILYYILAYIQRNGMSHLKIVNTGLISVDNVLMLSKFA